MYDAAVTWYIVMFNPYEPEADYHQAPNSFFIAILGDCTVDHYIWDKIFGINHTPWD